MNERNLNHLRRGTVVLGAALVLSIGGATAYSVGARSHTTVITNTGAGPALVLHNRSSAPPLQVSSSKKVVHLNADQVDGQSASTLEPTTGVWRHGKTNDSAYGSVVAKVPSGWYLATGRAAFASTDDSEAGATCTLFDAAQLFVDGDYSNLLSTASPSENQHMLSVAGVIFVSKAKGDTVRLQCSTPGSNKFVLLAPETLTLRPVVASIQRPDATQMRTRTP